MTPEELAVATVPCDSYVASALAPALVEHVRRVQLKEGDVDQRVVAFVHGVWVLANAFTDARASGDGLPELDPPHSEHEILDANQAADAAALHCLERPPARRDG